MAHDFSVSVTSPQPGYWLVDIDESDVGVASQVTLTHAMGIPKVGSIVRVVGEKVSGAATTVAPSLSTSTAFGGRDVVLEPTAAAQVDEVQTDGVPYAMEDDLILVHQATPDAGSNNVLQSRYLIREGWSF
jgi:hypothetical protein